MEKKSKLDNWFKNNVIHATDKQNLNQKIKKTFRSNNAKKLRLVFLGGQNEIGGNNLMLIEYGNDMVAIDMGLKFPEEDMLGVDFIVPDITYLEKNSQKLRGILITHGHLDHIGAIPFLAPKLKNPTFYGSRLTMGMIGKGLKERKLEKQVKLITTKPRETFKLGVFKITFFRVTHSIPDSMGIIVETPEGLIVHTGDFKFDMTPPDGLTTDMETLHSLGKREVLALLSESTYPTKEGRTISEKDVVASLTKIIKATKGRIIISCTSSVIGRMQQILNVAKETNRQVFVTGRSLVDNVAIATKLGYLKYPEGLVKDLRRNSKGSQASNALILTTGSQGESLSALTRMAMNEHSKVKLNSKDTIIYSSSPIVGNERAIHAVLNALIRKVAKVITNKHIDTHASGHGRREELKEMVSIVKPKYLIPIHGTHYNRHSHRELAMEEGMKRENVLLVDNGNVIEHKDGKLEITKETVPANLIMVDNQAPKLCGVASHIVSERQAMSLNGAIVISVNLISNKPQLHSVGVEAHGFIYMRQTQKVLKDMEAEAKKLVIRHLKGRKKANKGEIQAFLKSALDRVIVRNLQRRPLIVPIVNFI